MTEQLQSASSSGSAGGKAGALAAAAVIAGGTQAYADPVRFDNVGGQFVWSGQHLDVRRSSSAQANQASLSTVIQSVSVSPRPYYPYTPMIKALGDGSATLAQDYHYGMYSAWWTVDTASKGATIGNRFDFSGTHARSLANWVFVPNTRWYQYFFVPKTGTFYLPVRFVDGEDGHYGWIAGEWRGEEGAHALAWGYETTPNTPIAAGAVPVPGTLAALAFGAVSLGRRPKRGMQVTRTTKH